MGRVDHPKNSGGHSLTGGVLLNERVQVQGESWNLPLANTAVAARVVVSVPARAAVKVGAAAEAACAREVELFAKRRGGGLGTGARQCCWLCLKH